MRVAILLLLVACGADAPTQFDRGACGSGWGSATECDLACKDMLPANGSACEADRPDGRTVRCDTTFQSIAIKDEFQRGCCIGSTDHLGSGVNGLLEVWFYECQ